MKKKIENNLGDDLIAGLTEALAHERGEIKLRTSHREVPAAAPQYTKRKIKKIRTSFGMSQADFAKLLNVSLITVSSWEQGVREPKEATNRLLQVFEFDGSLVSRLAASKKGA